MAEVTLKLQPTEAFGAAAGVQTHQGRTGVWRLKDGALGLRFRAGGASSLDGRVQALSGLASGDTVVVYSDKPLSVGARFKVADALVKRPSHDQPGGARHSSTAGPSSCSPGWGWVCSLA